MSSYEDAAARLDSAVRLNRLAETAQQLIDDVCAFLASYGERIGELETEISALRYRLDES